MHTETHTVGPDGRSAEPGENSKGTSPFKPSSTESAGAVRAHQVIGHGILTPTASSMMTHGRYDLTQRMLEYTRRMLVTREYSPRTQVTYLQWIKRFMSHLGHPHPRALGRAEVERYLGYLANERRMSAKTRNQATSALAFLFREVLGSDEVASVKRARGGKRLPTVLSYREVSRILGELSGRKRLAAELMYGTGMRVSETLALRIKDLDFDFDRTIVRDGKGGKDRIVLLPDALRPDLHRLIESVRQQHARDKANGAGWSPLPGALHRKKTDAGFELGWQFLFPARKLSGDPKTGRRGRYHLDKTTVQRAFRRAVQESGVIKPATCHTLRHSFATQMLHDGCDIRTVQDLLGHKDIRTTMIYLHVLDQVGSRVRSPLDRDRKGASQSD